MLNDKELLNNYYEFVKNTRRPKTAKMYFFLLSHFISWLNLQKKGLHQLKIEDVNAYIISKSAWSNTAKIHFLVILKNFLEKYYVPKIPIGVTTNELRERLQIENNIKEILNYPIPKKETNNKQKTISLLLVKTLLEFIKKKSIDEYCLVWCLFYFGLRKSELIYLSPVEDINWKEKYIKIQASKSKTHVERVIYFNEYTKQALVTILKKYGSKDRMICNEETFLNKVLLKYSNIVKVQLFPHLCRHVFNTEMQKILKGNLEISELSVVRYLMGHSESSMTEHYTSIELIKQEAKKAMIEYHYMNKLK